MAHGAQYQYHDHLVDDSSISQRTPVSPLLQSQRLPLLQTTSRDGHDLNSYDLVSPIMSPSPSIASESRFSALSGGTAAFPSTPANVQPPAAYVAPFGAAQVVSDHQSALASEDGHEGGDLKLSKDDVSFSPSALALINAFLDQLLFSFLSTAKSTTLSALRTAVTDILRHKLARDAIASANEELADLLAGGDEDDEKESAQTESKLDVDLIWRRTRLRVMVYMRLGEMEDDDEERYVKEQDISTNGERSRFSSSAGLVSWSAAIFLTSVLEHVAEQTLQAAGSAASTRVKRQESAAVLVDDQDAERIALNPTLGRLWRSWRKTVRNVRPTTPANPRDETRTVSPSPAKSVSTYRDSFGTAPESARGDITEDEDEERVVQRPENDVPEPQYPEYVLASNIRLPMGDPSRDVDEIEIPGLAKDPSEAGSDGAITPTASRPVRRRSFSSYQSKQAKVKTPSDVEIESPEEEVRDRPALKKRRSTSVPAPMRSLLAALIGKDEHEEEVEGTKEDIVTTGPRQKTIGDLLLDEAPDAPRSAAAQEDYNLTIEELDKRKSLIDIKSLLTAINGGHVAFQGPDDRPSTRGSDKSFSLQNKENGVPQQPIAEPQHMGDADDELARIGVATTADRAIVPERSPSAAGTKPPSPAPVAVLSRASSVGRTKYSPELAEEVKQAQQTPIEAPARDRPIEPSEQTLAILRESVQRASSPQAAQTDPSQQNNRKSMTSQYASPVSAFSSQAIEHSTLQRQEPTREGGVTSANIRGPEDFDHFVQSDEVVKYTLTPAPIRNAPTANADSLAQLTGQVPEVVQSTSTNDNRSGRSQNGKTATSATGETMTEAEKKRHRFSVTKPPSRNSSVLRRSGMMAREARVITESTRDFADFIRSTRPDKEPQVQPFVTSQSSSTLQAYRNSTNYSLPRSQSLTGERTKSMTSSDIAKGFAPPVPNLPATKNKSFMQPRTANGISEESGELIAFIRDGPREQGQPRISRTVAPFRNTMDSDQFDALPATAKTPSSTSNRNSVMLGSPQMNGSMNSGSLAHPAYSGQPQTFNPLSSNPANVEVPRKRYRNKDPYALDLDDEDISALPRGRQSSVAADGDKPVASAASLAQARELMERARAKGSRSNSIYTTGDRADEVTALPTSSSKAADRLGYSERSNTNDLAEFLRSSEPPASSAPAPSVARAAQSEKAVPKEKKRSRGFSFFFRKPSSKGTASRHSRHADMP